MIWESAFWKDDLLRRARELRKRKAQRRWREESCARLEQLTMMGFYGVRKLIEAKKLSCATANRRVRLQSFRPTGKPVTLLSWHKLDLAYHLDRPEKSTMSLLELCNQFIHSYVFCPSFGEGAELAGFLFASDRQKRRGLLSVGIDQVIDVFELAGRDYPADGRWTLNPRTGDYDVTTGERPANTRSQRTALRAAAEPER